MNLTNKQLSILVDDIYKKHFQTAYDKEYTVYESSKKALKLTKQEEKIIENYYKTCVAYNKLTQRGNGLSISELKRGVLTSKTYNMRFKSTVPTKQQVEQAIVLATIDSKDMSDLVKAVTSKFKLK